MPVCTGDRHRTAARCDVRKSNLCGLSSFWPASEPGRAKPFSKGDLGRSYNVSRRTLPKHDDQRTHGSARSIFANFGSNASKTASTPIRCASRMRPSFKAGTTSRVSGFRAASTAVPAPRPPVRAQRTLAGEGPRLRHAHRPGQLGRLPAEEGQRWQRRCDI